LTSHPIIIEHLWLWLCC